MIVKVLIFGDGKYINRVEYALVGLNTGFSVVELSNPQNPTDFLYLERTLHEILKHGKIGVCYKRRW